MEGGQSKWISGLDSGYKSAESSIQLQTGPSVNNFFQVPQLKSINMNSVTEIIGFRYFLQVQTQTAYCWFDFVHCSVFLTAGTTGKITANIRTFVLNNKNFRTILNFRAISGQLWNFRNFRTTGTPEIANLPTLSHLAPSFGVTPFEFM